MNNGIKPTRLWHLTGKKRFRNLIQDRITAIKPRILDTRPAKETVRLALILASAVIAVSYSFGVFEPKKIIPPVQECQPPPPVPEKKKGQGTPPSCPSEEEWYYGWSSPSKPCKSRYD